MKRKRKLNERLAELHEAAKAVVARKNPPTLGACVYCGWPIAQMFTSRAPEPGTVCALCDRFTDTPFCRDFWNDYPANVI